MDITSPLKWIMSVAIAVVMLTATAEGAVVIDDRIRADLAAALANPQPVYPLDMVQNQKTFERIDQWAGKLIDLRRTEPKRTKNDRRTYWVEAAQNAPIALKDTSTKIDLQGPFRIKYVQAPQKRSLVKSIRVPSVKKLSDRAVAEIGKAFITEQRFLRHTQMDAIKEHLVLDRRCKPIDGQEQDQEALTILQRVVFKRAFNGLEVLNSKQIVDVHPASGEILAFKSIHWTPVDETKRTVKPRRSLVDIVHEIEAAFEKAPDTYRVVRIKPGMFQTDKWLFPVVAVYTARASDNDGKIPIQRVLYLPLAEDIELPEPKKSREMPTRASLN